MKSAAPLTIEPLARSRIVAKYVIFNARHNKGSSLAPSIMKQIHKLRFFNAKSRKKTHFFNFLFFIFKKFFIFYHFYHFYHLIFINLLI
ncbi:hypothetical protein JP34_07860 [Gallibacterium anatis]|nr:hypothetical protein JP34_07860 [Gallibacterium anatis]